MTTLIRWDPFREFMSLRNAMDRLFEEAFVAPRLWSEEPTTWGLALDVAEQDDAFLVKASIPGINPDDLEITLSDNVLTIKGEIKADKDIKEEQYHLRERRYGSFARSISLPTPVNADAVEATYEHGVLTLRIPKAEEAKPKRIAIRSNGHHKMIEGKATEVEQK